MALGKNAETRQKKIYKKLRNHYRLVILNIDTFEERFSMLLSPLNVIIVSALSLTIVAGAVFILLTWTPLRMYLPGYADAITTRKLAQAAALSADSLEVSLAQKEQYLENIRAILEGRPLDQHSGPEMDTVLPLQEVNYQRSHEDSLLRAEMEREELLNLAPDFNRGDGSAFLFFPPLKGTVTQTFDHEKQHFGIDVVTGKNESIKSIDEGTVILAAYTAETGYVIQVQHRNNFISIYKHNSVLLKSTGDPVRAGEAIAVVGETGEFSTGPHLHFELWRDGVALDPLAYVAFE